MIRFCRRIIIFPVRRGALRCFGICDPNQCTFARYLSVIIYRIEYMTTYIYLSVKYVSERPRHDQSLVMYLQKVLEEIDDHVLFLF